jgi:hypothetical protein
LVSSRRRDWFKSPSALRTPEANLRFPSTNRSSASVAEVIVLNDPIRRLVIQIDALRKEEPSIS